MSTQQPEWKCVGHIGDVDPIAHGGGFVYIDTTGVYGPELTWFEPGSDEQWHKTEGATKLNEYRVLLENNAQHEWWFEKLTEVAQSCGQDEASYREDALSTEPMKRALVYWDLLSYFGPHEFDSYPIERTEDEAYTHYADEMKMSRGAR
jgi:hypothetical protein